MTSLISVSSVSSVVNSIVTTIEKEILPRLRGQQVFGAVAVECKCQILSLPGSDAMPVSTPPQVGRARETRWQREGDFTLVYIVQGEVALHAGRRRIVCNTGHFALLFPTAWRAGRAQWFENNIANTTSRVLWFTFKPGMTVCHGCRLQDGVPHEAWEIFVPDNRLHPLVPLLARELNETPSADAIRRLLWLFLDRVGRRLREDSFLMTRPTQQNLDSGEASQGIGEKALRYVEANLMEKLTLESVARAIFSTRTRVARDFKAHTGVPLGTYLQRRRLEQAKLLLRTTPDSIALIARRSGFSTPDYFCAAFRKSEGMTPSEYRERR